MSAPPNPPSRPAGCPRRSPGRLLAAAFALALASSAAPCVRADATPEYRLVVLAEPQPVADLAGGADARDVTVPYHVVEIFRGEPGAVDITVRHAMLPADQRRSLAAAHRVIVMANPDTGVARFQGPAPLRATPEAVAAFRSWSAPPDVRPERDVAEVIAEVATDVVVAPRGERPPPVGPSPAPATHVTAPEPPAAAPAEAPTGASAEPLDAPPVMEEVAEDEPDNGPSPAAASPAPPRAVEPLAPHPSESAAPPAAIASVAPAPRVDVVEEDVVARDEDAPAPAAAVPATTTVAVNRLAPADVPAAPSAAPPPINRLEVTSATSPAPVAVNRLAPAPHPAEVALGRLASSAEAPAPTTTSPGMHPAEVALARLAEEDAAAARRQAFREAAAAAPPRVEPRPSDGPEPPRMYEPVFVPRGGPGLPPAPAPGSVLGPSLDERRDLHVAK